MPTRRRLTLRPSASGAMVALLCVLGARTARDVSSPWLRMLVVGAVMIVVVDASWSLLAVRRLRLELVPAPVGTVGQPLACRLAVSGSALPVVVRMLSVERGPDLLVHPPAQGVYAAAPDRRGVHPSATVRTLTRSPFGLLAAGWVWQVGFDSPVLVGPAPVVVTVTGASGPPARAEYGGEDTRGVRPYVAGDRPALVHWPATARAGELVVRQVERDQVPPIVVAVDLGPDAGPPAERAAGVGAGLAEALLGRGDRVEVVTTAGRRTVADSLEVSAALALARPGPVPRDGADFVVTPSGVEVV